MKVFDFDETILHGNSVRRFFGYCLVRLPYLVLYLPVQLVACLLYAVKILNKDRFLSVLESFVLFVPCKKKFIVRFWDKNFKHIKSWYLSQHSDKGCGNFRLTFVPCGRSVPPSGGNLFCHKLQS